MILSLGFHRCKNRSLWKKQACCSIWVRCILKSGPGRTERKGTVSMKQLQLMKTPPVCLFNCMDSGMSQIIRDTVDTVYHFYKWLFVTIYPIIPIPNRCSKGLAMTEQNGIKLSDMLLEIECGKISLCGARYFE